jgi:MFS transporter, UMF1 family
MTEPPRTRKIWGWWWFDWANQPYNTLLLTFIFAPYFASAPSRPTRFRAR